MPNLEFNLSLLFQRVEELRVDAVKMGVQQKTDKLIDGI